LGSINVFYDCLTSGRFEPMVVAKMLTTTVSAKGQVILPTTIWLRRKWVQGTRLLIEEEGILLKPAPTFAETRPDEVFGMLFRKGKPTTLEKMDAGVLAETRRRHPRD
jgi:bifunctional DNA-binding transcriptional regulator/antitoxin component of YhaV-PrlF toxin-antitoxin module